MSTPTIHDNDRKAAEVITAETIAAALDTWGGKAPEAEFTTKCVEHFALIIARHHAEERAAVEKVYALAAWTLQQRNWHHMADEEKALVRLLVADGFLGETAAGFSGFTTAKTNAALTALRNASRSPTP